MSSADRVRVLPCAWCDRRPVNRFIARWFDLIWISSMTSNLKLLPTPPIRMARAISTSGSKLSSGQPTQLRSRMASSNDAESPCAKVSRTRLVSCILAESIPRKCTWVRCYRQLLFSGIANKKRLAASGIDPTSARSQPPNAGFPDEPAC